MAGLSASGLKTQIRSYTETDSNVLTDAVLENMANFGVTAWSRTT